MTRALPDPQRLVDALLRAGWVRAGQRTGVYVRLRLSNERSTSLVVPLDPAMGDYPDLMGAVLGELEVRASAGQRAQQVLDEISAASPGEGAC